MKYSLSELQNLPIEELPNNPEPDIYYYLDKGFGEERNYHMYFYYEDGTYDILDYEEGIYELDKETYLKNMRKSLFHMVSLSIFEFLLDENVEYLAEEIDESDEIEYFIAAKILIENTNVPKDQKIYIKEFYTLAMEEMIEDEMEVFRPYQMKFYEGTITGAEILEYNEIKDEINELKRKKHSINQIYENRGFSKIIEDVVNKQEELLQEFKNINKES